MRTREVGSVLLMKANPTGRTREKSKTPAGTFLRTCRAHSSASLTSRPDHGDRPVPTRTKERVMAGTGVAALLGLSGVMALQATAPGVQAADGSSTTVDNNDAASTTSSKTW